MVASKFKWQERESLHSKSAAQDLVNSLKKGDRKDYPVFYKIIKTRKGFTVYQKLSAAWNKYRK
jgi:hypothetical protein